jgi:hypothetical protein
MILFQDMAALFGSEKDGDAIDHTDVAVKSGEGVTSSGTTDLTNVITSAERSFNSANCIDFDF